GSPIKKFGSPIMKFSSRLFEAEGNTKLQATNKVIKECREDLTTQLNDKKRFLFDGDVQYSSMAEVIEQGCVEENVKCANADSDNE
ncbi:MAG: hypothetical protein J6Y94_03160, partial [Bacteriovoracaceae bacterium]|nr:hypothetical protein [Bacteriovoracaceae bacterium]